MLLLAYGAALTGISLNHRRQRRNRPLPNQLLRNQPRLRSRNQLP